MDIIQFKSELRLATDEELKALRLAFREESAARQRAYAASFRIGEEVEFETDKKGGRWGGKQLWRGTIKNIGPKNLKVTAKPVDDPSGKVVIWTCSPSVVRRPGKANPEYEPV